ncbi:hypothetical protein H1R20_g9642, partial [Candolleomyces eurysporus]
MTLSIYTKTEIDSIYLITYVRLYFILNAETKIHLGSFIVRNLVSDVIDATQSAIQRLPSTLDLAAALALLDQNPEDIPTLVNSATSSVAHLPSAQTPPDLRPAKRKRATSDPDAPKQSRSGNPDPNQPSSSDAN